MSLIYSTETKSSYFEKHHRENTASKCPRQARKMVRRSQSMIMSHVRKISRAGVKSEIEQVDDETGDYTYRIHRRNNSLPDITTTTETDSDFWCRKTSCKQYSLQRSQSVEWDPVSALFTATAEDDTSEMKRILTEFKLEVNFLSPAGISLLHTAAIVGSVKAIKLLLEFGAKVDFQDENGQTTLEVALLAGYFDCASLLIKAGASLGNVIDGIQNY